MGQVSQFFCKTYRMCLPSSQKVLAVQPTIYPVKKLWQLNQQYIQRKSYGSLAQPTIPLPKNFWQLIQQYL